MPLLTSIGRLGRRCWRGVADLFYPQFCLGCDQLLSGETKPFICLSCSEELPFTNYHELEENPVTDRFAGRIPLFFGGAFLIYKNQSITQSMIAQLKYYNRPDIAEGLGRLYGQQLKNCTILEDLDFIVPVPLHPKRELTRGYNQAERIGYGLERSLDVPCNEKALIRNKFEASQTKKNQEERFKNVSNVFSAGSLDLTDKKVLLVDDVLTTGATLEACAEALITAYSGVKIGVATIGMRE